MKRGLTPWVRAGLGDTDWLLVRSYEARGVEVSGFAGSARGPFTVRLWRNEAQFAVGCGATAHEALIRASVSYTERAT